jgi:hypothetical protein
VGPGLLLGNVRGRGRRRINERRTSPGRRIRIRIRKKDEAFLLARRYDCAFGSFQAHANSRYCQIKLKVKKGKGDHERDANRQELLQFLNAAYD